ncbi:GNAT family N-acetyltransferase [Streptomyces sp. NPDC048606]|uniref:GNAT family N-acetyltransferase n=1 Tax=Streptomyces sp. NPDC048606 TaxID=3154726 RepID=UPI00343E64D2
MSADVRPIAASELPAWLTTVNTGFLTPGEATASDVAARSKYGDLARTLGGFDTETGSCVATFRSFAQELTVPGGAAVASSAITNVTVLPTHRRQGLLTRMMADELAAAHARGDVVSTLIAAEYPIYGRYGFGPAASHHEWEVDVPRTGLDRHRALLGPGEGRVDLVDVTEVRRVGPALHERLRAAVHGVVNRDARWWSLRTGLEEVSHRPYRTQMHAVYRNPAGEVEGLVDYVADDHWTDAKLPQNTLQVNDLIAVTPAAERALWRFVCSVDWVLKVRTGRRAPDDLLPSLLPDARTARLVTAADFLWVRVLDVVRALQARTYAVPGVLVLEVEDPAGPAGGRYRLDAGAGTCARTEDPADLRLGASELGSLYLGGESAVRLGALGRVTQLRPGALALAESVFRTARSPWCPDVF